MDCKEVDKSEREATESKQDNFPQGIVSVLFHMKKCVFLQDIFKL
jgi:hypothetical protein